MSDQRGSLDELVERPLSQQSFRARSNLFQYKQQVAGFDLAA